MKILIDNGHGENTAGKRSPDGLLLEYKYAREIAQEVERQLITRGYDAERIVREEVDVKLSERVSRVNSVCRKLGTGKVLLVSIHCNAAGRGGWMTARGWEAYTCKGQTKSDRLATMLYEQAQKSFNGMTIRKDFSDGDPDKEENFYILKNTLCAAVLTENFFMDNKQDVSYMLSYEGRQNIVRVHVEGIIDYIKKYCS